MNHCKNCNKELELIEGKEAKVFCSNRCRMAFKRNSEHRNTEQRTINTEQLTPNISDRVVEGTPNGYVKGETLDNENGRIVGFCSYCLKEVTQENFGNNGNNWDLIRCCMECSDKIRKGEIKTSL